MTTHSTLQYYRLPIFSLLLLASICLLPLGASAQVGFPPRQAPVQAEAMPFVQNAPARVTAIEARHLLPGTWLRFNRMPATTELAALRHARAPGVLVLHLAAVPTVAETVRLGHAPKDWRVIMILPIPQRANHLLSLRHLRRSVEVAFPGLPPQQTATVLQPYRQATPSTISSAVCGHIIRR